ncbi:C4-dicarboxylate transport protein [Tessaracoccus sp. O5.2]|nr:MULTISPECIES: dicarboxylate/amino acid:cation symporter [Tessaracoccus]AQX16636.1 sodium:proton antiporter [Tessaracoccus sp. T2.5-30]VEP41345.1 C4-dicarboxylate transport protein [Tessaracoccus lapidicaptus]
MSTISSERAPETTAPPRKPFYTNLGFQIVVGLVAGVVLGLIAVAIGPDGEERNWLAGLLYEVGGAYVSLLTLLVVPLVVTAVISSIARLREVTNAARLAVQTLIWFAITALASVIVGIGVGLISSPWLTAGVDAEAAAAPGRVGSWTAFLTGLIPNNIFGLGVRISGDAESGFAASPSFSVLQVLLISILFGIAAVKVGDKAAPFVGFMESALSVIQKVLWWIIRLAPIGTAALIGRAVATYGWSSLASLGTFVAALYIGLIIVWAVVYPAILKFHGLGVREFYRNVWPAISLGFVTRSSMGTMPVTEQVVERNVGVPRQYASFAVPLGATTKMDGCAAVFPALASIFVAQFYGIDLGLTHYLLIAFVAVLGSSATAGTTGATVMLTLTLSTLGLPLEGVGLLLAVEPIVDMGRTALNVTGQALVPAVVAKREGILDEATYSARPQFSA